MAVSLYKRSSVLKKILFFILLTFIYLHVLVAINNGKSALDHIQFLTLYSDRLYLVYIGVMTLYFVYFAKPISQVFFTVFSLLYLYAGVEIFFANFNKLILIFNFIFLVLSFYFFLYLRLELQEAIYQPSFDKFDVSNVDLHNIKVSLRGKFGKGIIGHITNWDSSGCFLQLDKDPHRIYGPVGVKIIYLGNEFFQRGHIVTSYSNGVGIKFKGERRKRKKTVHDWLDFYAIIHDMGLKPRKV